MNTLYSQMILNVITTLDKFYLSSICFLVLFREAGSLAQSPETDKAVKRKKRESKCVCVCVLEMAMCINVHRGAFDAHRLL